MVAIEGVDGVVHHAADRVEAVGADVVEAEVVAGNGVADGGEVVHEHEVNVPIPAAVFVNEHQSDRITNTEKPQFKIHSLYRVILVAYLY